MLIMTKNGIVYNLAKSPYFTSTNGITYYFSSKLHLQKFINRDLNHKQIVTQWLFNKFKFFVNFQVLIELDLYKRIETRGFYIMYNGRPLTQITELRVKTFDVE